MPHEIRFFFRTGIDNSRLAGFLARFQAQSPLPSRLEQQGREISLLARGTPEELAQLAEELGREIPLSIFLRESGLVVVPQPQETGAQNEWLELTAEQNLTLPSSSPLPPLPPCPRCLQRAEDNFQAGRVDLAGGCRLCQPPPADAGYLSFAPSNGQLKLEHQPKQNVAAPNSPDPEAQHGILAAAAARLAEGDCLQLETTAGTFSLAADPASLPSRQHNRPGSYVVQLTSLRAMPEYWHCGEDELLRLGALEKPLVLLPPTEKAMQQYRLPPLNLPVGLADNLPSWYLGRHLEAKGIPLLFITEQAAIRHRPRVLVDGAKTWLLGGERALLPLQLALNFAPQRHTPVEHEQVRLSLSSPPQTTGKATDSRHDATTTVRLTTVAATPTTTGGQPWPPGRHRQDFTAFLATAPELTQPAAKGDQQLFGISLQREPGGMALLTASKIPLSRILMDCPAAPPLTCGRILSQVAELDHEAQRLLANYARRYPRHWQNLEGQTNTLRVDSLADLGTMLLALCRPEEGDSPPSAADFFALAAHFTPGRSPLLELGGEDHDALLDHRRLLRSVISYTLAGATPAALCRALLESLAERLARRIWEETPPGHQPRVALCTPLCLHPAFFPALRRQGGENFLLAPPPLPLTSLPAIGQLWPAPPTTATEQPLPDQPERDEVDGERRRWLQSAGRFFRR